MLATTDGALRFVATNRFKIALEIKDGGTPSPGPSTVFGAITKRSRDTFSHHAQTLLL
jgi:hypothetical protein